MENISINDNMADMEQPSWGSKFDKNSKRGKENKTNVKQREEEVNKTRNTPKKAQRERINGCWSERRR